MDEEDVLDLPEIVVRGEGSVSDRIRALDAAGYQRADIARILNKRYQHVRNVLEEDANKRRKGPVASTPTRPKPLAPAPARSERHGHVMRMRLGEDGSVVLPPELLASFGFKPGSIVIAELEGETLVIPSRAENLRRIQADLRQYIPEGVSLVDELIAERRRENAKDERGE